MLRLELITKIKKNGNHFAGWADEYSRFVDSPQRDAHYKQLCDMLDVGDNDYVVDTPSGTGKETLDTIAPRLRNGFVDGIDLAPDMISLAQRLQREKQVYNARFILGNVENLPLRSDSVDKIISGHGYQWFKNRNVALGEFNRTLKDGGDLGLMTVLYGSFWPIMNAITIVIDRFSKYYGSDNAEKILGFVPQSENSLRTALESYGFGNIEFQIPTPEIANNFESYLLKTRAIAATKDYFERLPDNARIIANEIVKGELLGKELIEEKTILVKARVKKKRRL